MTAVEIKLNDMGRVIPLNEQFSPEKDETPEAWTDRLTRAAREAGTKRQCSIGWHLECSDPTGEECKCACHPWPDEVIAAPMDMGQRDTPWYWEFGIGWEKEPEMTQVPIDALNALIEYADAARTMRDQDHVCGAAEQADSDREFTALIDALGLPDADEEG